MNRFNVLLIGRESKQTEVYGTLIRELTHCKIDVLSRLDNALSWMPQVQYDLVVIDFPEPTQILERIKRFHPESAVIVISDQVSVEEAVKTIRMGGEDYLRKPVHFDSFRFAVRRSIDRRGLFESDGIYGRFLHLVSTCQLISASLDESRVMSLVRSYIAGELGSQSIDIFARDEKNELVSVLNDEGVPIPHTELFRMAFSLIDPDTFELKAETDFIWRDEVKTSPSLFAFKIKCTSQRDRFLVCVSPKKPESFENFITRLRVLSAQITVTGQNILRYQDVQLMAYVDDVTGLHNTRYLNKVLEREIEKANEVNRQFAILFVDIDYFKKVNDSHGHLVGSKVLQELGSLLKTHVRESDHIVRYGGDEFVIILSPSDLNAAVRVAERIRESAEQTKFLEKDTPLALTLSIGVAIYPLHARNKEEILTSADHALYSAKKESRNTVFLATTRSEKTG